MGNTVIVKDSKIQGKGVFAARDFKKGDIVLEWGNSLILTPEQAEKIPDEDKKYIYYDGNKRVLVDPPARFVNHSCDPNTFIRNFCGMAKRDIKKGEEITEDYSKENNPNFSMECNCGSKNCKGMLKTDS
ncbi:MAG: SET domain-containing protein-lysine N-methyltransferase [Nanoarchaeota archaeon]|nr:SET domain-containing protein-lysine N-methyltransferase [Nanoarchaeota archaeon]